MDILLATFGEPESVLNASLDAIIDTPGMTRAAACAIKEVDRGISHKVVDAASRLGAEVLLPSDARFPETLKQIPNAPILLFALGNLELLHTPAVGIVGSRSHSSYGAGACRLFASGVVREGIVVVSGLARGLDSIAHKTALENGGGTVGVLGNGLGVVYPAANRDLYDSVAEEGCLLTEFPPGERPNVGNFPRRNRLISGLSKLTLVVEARERSGALITADCALTQGKEVLAVPGPITSPLSLGCNRLIQMGAKPAIGVRDILEEFGKTTGNAPAIRIPSDLTSGERKILDIVNLGTEHIDDIATHVDQPVEDVSAFLTSLEVRGLVNQLPGKVFRAIEYPISNKES